MHTRTVTFCALLITALPTSDAVAEAPPAAAFARLPTFADLEISPGGRYFAARLNRDNRYFVSIFKTGEDGIEYVYGLEEDDTRSIAWFRWVSEDRLVASIAFTGKRGSRRRVQTDETRLIAIEASTATVISLFRNKRDEIPIQIQDRIVSFLPDDPDRILVQYSRSNPNRPNVYEVDVTRTARHKTYSYGREGVYRWTADADGEIRLGEGVSKGRAPLFIVREKSEKKWKDLSHRLSQDGVQFDPIDFSVKPNEIYVRSNHEGDPLGIYTFDITTDTFGNLIYQHPSVDVSSVDIDEKTSELLSVSFVEDAVSTKRFIVRPIQEIVRRFGKQMGDVDVRTRSISSDGNYAVIRISGVTDAGTYYLLNGLDNSVKVLPPQYPDLENIVLGRTVATEYVARDGLLIPAFVTLPPHIESLEDARHIPFVVYPHGGPGARDFLRFSFRVQFLVSRGYGVLQMNYRGSTGYGQAFKDAGAREWGQAMQDDITDGVKWLIDEQHADAERIAIVGGSYGGYAALMGAVKTPDLYQCAVSFAGVSDLPDLLRRARQFVAGKYRTRFIGDLWKDRKMLAENSPARRTREIEIPILLMHGDQDTVVDFDQSKNMAKQLRRNDKEHVFVEFENGDHYLSLYQNRLRYLEEMESFLATCLN